MKARLLVAVGVLLLACSASTVARAFPIAVPGTEGRLVVVTSSAPVVATYLGNSATYSDDLFLMLDAAGNPGDDGNLTNDRFVFNNHTSAVGSTVTLGTFAPGTELQFRLNVHNTGYNFSTGPGTRNPDNVPHARVQENYQPEVSLVSFEDLYGTPEAPGGFNDLSFSFTHTSTNLPPVPQGFPANNVLSVCNVADRAFSLSTGFTSPEANQITTTVVTTNLPAGQYTLTNTAGNPSQQTLEFTPVRADLGHTYAVTYAATDNATTPLTTTVTLSIVVDATNCPTPAQKSSWGTLKLRYR